MNRLGVGRQKFPKRRLPAGYPVVTRNPIPSQKNTHSITSVSMDRVSCCRIRGNIAGADGDCGLVLYILPVRVH